jgi:hypothetical protein
VPESVTGSPLGSVSSSMTVSEEISLKSPLLTTSFLVVAEARLRSLLWVCQQ